MEGVRQRVTDGDRRCLAAALREREVELARRQTGRSSPAILCPPSAVVCLYGESEGFANSSDSRRHNSRLQSAQLMRAQEETERRRSSCRFSSEHRDEPRSHAPTGTGDGSEAAEARSLSHPRLITATSHLIIATPTLHRNLVLYIALPLLSSSLSVFLPSLSFSLPFFPSSPCLRSLPPRRTRSMRTSVS